MKEETKVRRAALAVISQGIKPLVRMGVYSTVNEGLIEMYQKETGAREFNSFLGWKEKGKSVKKGSKAVCVWGAPRKYEIEKDAEQAEIKAFRFFPLAYLFGDNQVS